MAIEYQRDGDSTFIRGQNSAKVADQLEHGQFAAGVNLSTDRGVLQPRWGFKRLKLNFVDQSTPEARQLETLFYAGRFQALIPYSVGPTFYLIAVVSGVIYLINQETLDVTILSIAGGTNLNENTTRLNWSNAARFLVIFDFPNRPVIIEGFNARRADPALYEVPISTIGTYNSNRLFIGNAGNEFTAGDPVGSLLTPNAPITFEEVLAPSAPYVNQVFQLTTNYNNDPITAMAFLQVADTGTGIGPLLVSTRSAIYTYQAQNPRDTWEQGQFGTVYIYNAGIAGPQSFTNVNSDIMFMSSDGQLRSLSMARDAQQKWANVPISREVENWLKFTDLDLAKYASLVYYKNKVFVTANPYRVKARNKAGFPVTDIAHGGLVVLNLSNISTLTGGDAPPVWDGLWTAMRPMGMVLNNDKMFVISKEGLYLNQLYVCTPETTIDSDSEKERPIKSILYSREYSWESPFQNKELHSIDINLANMKGAVTATLDFKPAHAANFLLWRTFKHEAPYQQCGIPMGCEVNGFEGHQFLQLNFGQPLSQNVCEPVSQAVYGFLRKVQLRISIEARYWELHEYIIKATLKPQSETVNVCEPTPVITLCKDCNLDWAIGPFEKCLS